MRRVKSLAPIIDAQSRIIVLGTMPSAESLRKTEYYANPHNQFWRVLYAVFNTEPDYSYNKKMQFLRRRRISVWDVVDICEREGSLDHNITNETANDFQSLFKQYKNLKLVAFNGVRAESLFRKHLGFDLPHAVKCIRLPSTSQAHTVPFSEKVKKWEILKK